MSSCEKDDTPLVKDQTFNTEKIWEYSGDTKVLKKIIKKVKQSAEGKKLEQDVNRSSVLWNKGEFILINNKKHMLFPVLNIKKNKIRGLVSFSQKNINVIKQDTALGKSIKKQKIDINYTFINRWDLSKKDKTFPFWTKPIMRGYFDALDKDILGKQNRSKGIVKKEIPEERKKAILEQQKLIRSLSSGYYEEHCTYIFIEHCIDVPTFEADEVEYVEDHCYIEVEEDCYLVWVENEEEEEDCFDETNPDCSNFDVCAADPCACDDCDEDDSSDSSNDDLICKGCEDIIIIDDSFKEIDAYCAYKALKNTNGNLFRKTIGSFITDPKYDLRFEVGECKTSDDACTDGKKTSSGRITITIEDRNMRSLEAAATILHEGIHAELFRFVQEAHNGNVDPNDRKRLFDLYYFYNNNSRTDPSFLDANAQHAYMAENYVRPIAQAIRQLDGNKYPLSHYMGFGWDGLRGYDYKGLLTDAQDDENIRLKKIANDNTTFDPKNCK